MVATIVTAPLFVRMTPDELGRVRAAASGQLLSASSWARRIIMGALEAVAAVGEAEGLARAAAGRTGPGLASAAARTLPLPFKRKKVLAPKKKAAAKLPKHKPSTRRKPLPKKSRGRK